jgi:hypothetical protein
MNTQTQHERKALCTNAIFPTTEQRIEIAESKILTSIQRLDIATKLIAHPTYRERLATLLEYAAEQIEATADWVEAYASGQIK